MMIKRMKVRMYERYWLEKEADKGRGGGILTEGQNEKIKNRGELEDERNVVILRR